MAHKPAGTPLPNLAKAEGAEPEATDRSIDDLTAELSHLKERTDAERIALTQEVYRFKAKFSKTDAEVARYQTAVAQLVAENDAEKRKAIRDSLAN